ncbi:hypothetical protein DSO57_1038612 [Entomophthora muscae]|uniref:Uncharacterized protein n=1 Tax=Entomophthora muscae TaxID=34485 RepID=A0ACC2TWJ3_9FUNG|nr:hypothetical protein DSO57_1038612 [Entomophthora muscae]
MFIKSSILRLPRQVLLRGQQFTSSAQPKPPSKLRVALPIAFGTVVMYVMSINIFKGGIVQKKLGEEESSLAINESVSRAYLLEQQDDKSHIYNDIAFEYDDKISMDELVLGMYLLRRWLIKRHAKGDVLELSSGTGRNMKYYYPTIASSYDIKSLTLVEKSKNMIEAAMKTDATLNLVEHFKKKRKTLRFYQRDAHHLVDFEDNSFDTVVDTFGLCSYSDPVKVLREMQRVCKPGGKILLLQHGTGYFDFLNNLLDKNADKHAEKWGCWWNRDITEILDNSGLKASYINRWHFGTTFYVVATPNKP